MDLQSLGTFDIHAHFLLPSSEREARDVWQAMLGQGIYFAAPHVWSVEHTLTHMDQAGTAMQLLSYIPSRLRMLREANDYGATVVDQHPSRFGLLAALPTDNVEAAIAEAKRAHEELGADGFAVTANYNGTYLGDPSLRPLWELLASWDAVVFVHPDARKPAVLGHPVPLYEVAFETARAVFDMMFREVFSDYPEITFVVAHCGGAFPALTGRLSMLGNESWVPQGITAESVARQSERLFVDTAATATLHALQPALATVGDDHIVYGSDWGAPCTTPASMAANRDGLFSCGALDEAQAERVLGRGWELFPAAAARRRASLGMG